MVVLSYVPYNLVLLVNVSLVGRTCLPAGDGELSNRVVWTLMYIDCELKVFQKQVWAWLDRCYGIEAWITSSDKVRSAVCILNEVLAA